MKTNYISKLIRALLAVIIFSAPGFIQATDKITIADGTSTNEYVPIYGHYADYAQKCEFIIPATDLTSLNGKNITELKFYSNTANHNWDADFLIFMKEVDKETLTGFTGYDDDKTVYEGKGFQIDANKEMLITFTTPYTYKGGNLLIGIYHKGGKYKKMAFVGKNQDAFTAVSGYDESGLDAVKATPTYFIPKTTITYEEGVMTEGPSLTIVDYPRDSEFDFGTVAAGTQHTFTLRNQGGSILNIEGIEVTGDYIIVKGGDITSIASGETAEVTVSTKAKDSSGTLTISSNDPESPYTINLKNTYKVPRAEMSVTPTTLDLGKVTTDATGVFTVSNSGDADLTATITSDNTAFEVSETEITVKPDESLVVTVTYKYNAQSIGVNKANINIKPNGSLEEAIVTVYAKVADPNAWTENFDGNTLPAGWEADGDGWSFSDGVAKGTKVNYSSKYYLTTPSLEVNEGDELTFQYKATSYNTYITIQFSKDGGDFKDYNEFRSNTMSDFADYTIKDLEPGTYQFRFENGNYELDNFEGFKLNLNAPKMKIAPLENADFGKVYSKPQAKTYTVTNGGTGKLTVKIESSNEDFTVTPAILEDIEAYQSATFTIAFNYDIEQLGEKEATIKVTPTYNETVAVSIKATALSKDPNIWEEDFEEGKLPENWSTTGWTIEKSTTSNGNGTYMAYAGTNNNSPVLITPRLYATKGQTLKFEVGSYTDSYTPLTVEYSPDQNEWTMIDGAPLTSGGVHTFTAPEEGYYYLRFQGRYGRVDNFVGFKLALDDHALSISAENIPETACQYVEYTASVTVKEMNGKNEIASAELFFGGKKVAEDLHYDFGPNDEIEIKLSFLPTEKYVGSTEAYIVVTYAGDHQLISTKKNVEVTPALVWDEEAKDSSFEETGEIPAIVFKYTPNPGWNTISVPFALTDDHLIRIFGESYAVFELKEYNNFGVIVFEEAEKNEDKYAAGYPYAVLVNTPRSISSVADTDDKEMPIILNKVKIERKEAQGETSKGVTFAGSFSSRALEGEKLYEFNVVNHALEEAKAVKGFRAYISLDNSIPSNPIPPTEFYYGNGIETGIEFIPQEIVFPEGIYNLNGLPAKQPLAPGIYIINGKKTVVN